MTELALNILDIATNSVRANAKTVKISVCADSKADTLAVEIEDDGCGMSEELLQRVADPFATTRTTRKVGMGIPFFKMAAELTGGAFAIKSTPGKGTVTSATFGLGHIDRAPLGDLASTMAALIGGSRDIDFVLDYTADGQKYEFDTKEVKAALETDDLTEAYLTAYLEDMIRENIEKANGGLIL